MSSLRILRFCIAFLPLVFSLYRTNAQRYNMNTREWSSVKSAGALKTCLPLPPASPRCDTLLSQVDFFTTPGVIGTNFNVKEVRSFVKLAVNHDDGQIFAPYTYRVGFEVRGYRTLNSTQPSEIFQDTLMINYNPDSTNAYQDQHIRSYYGYYRLEMRVLNIYDYTDMYSAQVAGSTTIPPPVALYDQGAAAPALAAMKTNWTIEAGMALQTFDLKLSSGTPSNVFSNTMSGIRLLARNDALAAGSNSLHVYWDLSASEAPVPAMYELEWTYADNYKITMLNDGTLQVADKPSVSYDYRENSTRVITNKTNFEIPIIYKRGYLAYRVRMLRPDNNYQGTKYSEWSTTTDHGTIPGTPTVGFFKLPDAHLSDHGNWNYEASFAEEGKSKQVLGYFDGLLKNRQTLTRFSSRPSEIIGAEKFYDYEGRVGLQTLPVPLLGYNSLSYVNNFALSSATQQPYKAADFDPLIAPGPPAQPLEGLAATSAAKAYYSPQNSLLGAPGYSMIKALPDAEGFPLIQTHYAPDDPSRIKVQGSAGKELQIGKGHETGYFYADPGQEELNPYFGSNIGKAKFYEKIITRDPNKELSFSIVNNNGKPVMTGLMGFPDPANNTTLLNLDGVTAPTGTPPFDDLLYGNPPSWSGSTRIFNKTFFKETSGGNLKFRLNIPSFLPCTGSTLMLGVPVTYSVSIQGEYEAAPQTIIANTTATPPGGSASGPSVAANLGPLDVPYTQAGLSGIAAGEQTITYKASYNPDDIDTAVKRYLRTPALYNGSCFKNEQDFINLELSNLVDNCEDLGVDAVIASECGQYESIMKMQLMPRNTYCEYKRLGSNRDVIVGNGRSLFAIIGWTQRNPANQSYPAVTPVMPSAANTGNFEPTVWPSAIANSADINVHLDAVLSYYTPLYAYQYYLPALYVSTEYNGQYVNIDNNTPAGDLLSMYNDEVATALLPIHPEYCEYRSRFCDASDYVQQLQAIPNVQVAKQLDKFTISELVASDPFSNVYDLATANVPDGLKIMAYKTVNGAGVINGSRQITLECFAYLKTMCDDATDPQACWGTNLPNSSGALITAPANAAVSLTTLIDQLTNNEKELYYQYLIDLYITNRGNRIAAYRDDQYACEPHLAFKDDNNEVFRQDLNSDGSPRGADGPPSYTSFVSGNLYNNTRTVIANNVNAGGPGNELDEYATTIIRQLLNCREISSPNYNGVLFSNLLATLKAKMQSNAMLNKDKIWKGGITPADIKSLIQSAGLGLGDLCNPYLIDYGLSAKSMVAPCGTAPADYCDVVTKLKASVRESFLKKAIINLRNKHFNSSYAATSGSGSVYLKPSIIFDRTLLVSLGYDPGIARTVAYTWSASSQTAPLVIVFTNGTKQVSIIMEDPTPSNVCMVTANNFTGCYFAEERVTDFWNNYYSTTGGFANFNCDSISSTDTLRMIGTYVYNNTWNDPNDPPEDNNDPQYLIYQNGHMMKVHVNFVGLDLSGLIDRNTDSTSLPCIHTCIACNELKDAYKVYQSEVAGNYGIKGKGHPFYETSLRSFLNYYFRNRHYSDEYLNFMKGCNLTDSLFLPEYYGYFQAHGSANEITAILGAARNYSTASPVVPPLAGPSPAQVANMNGIKYFRYADANGMEHLYIDYASVYHDERLRLYISYLNSWLAANAGSATWAFNMLNSEIAGQPPFGADIFLPGTGTPLPTGLAVTGIVTSSENVTVKDGPVGTAGQHTEAYTHHRFEAFGSPGSVTIASAWGQLGTDLYNTLHTPPGIDNVTAFSSHESFRNTHGNLSPDKVSYLNYVYNLTPGTSHDAILEALSAPNVRSAVYTTGGVIQKDVAYRHGIAGNPADPSGTLQLQQHGVAIASAASITFIERILNRASFQYPTGSFPWMPPPAPPTIQPPQSNPFYRISRMLMPGMPPTIPVISYNTVDYKFDGVRLLANNTYAYTVKRDVGAGRNYNIHLRLPAYINNTQACRYELVNIEPYISGESKRYFSATFRIPGNPSNTFKAIGKADFDVLTTIPAAYRNVMLCDVSDEEDNADSITICYDAMIAQALVNASNRNGQYQDSLYRSLSSTYRQFIATYTTDELQLSTPQMKYAVTLYSYDRAGNLIATVPPMGVTPMSSTAGVNNYRETGTGPAPVPAHTKQTRYTYGSLNQKLTETTPDAGSSFFIYDRAGRMLFSQNSRQATTNRYSYTFYDGQNRPVETGQILVSGKQTYVIQNLIQELRNQQFVSAHNLDYMKGLLAGIPREEVIRTTYDTAMYVINTADNGMSKQENLRSRVSTVASYPKLAANSSGYAGYDIALHYSYDLTGNLKTLTYDMPLLNAERQRYKRIDYDYDLYSGKVTLVSYNRSFADQFFQRYQYDEDNRITKTETSKDGVIWDRDAAYTYYPHGPLARISLGDQRVQGIDFAYTLQGWLKSINGDSPGGANDIGADGVGQSAHQEDLYRTTLSYFDGDYKPVDASDATGNVATKLLKLPPPPAANRSLYNGNIAASSNLPGYFPSLYTTYRYDKLNRIREANYELPDYNSTSPIGGGTNPYNITGSLANLYHSDYSYDLDGNLKTLNRYGFKPGNGGTATGGQVYLMDQLNYIYLNNTKYNNRLTNFTDVANHFASSGFTNDLGLYNDPNAQNIMRLQYDPSGNLTRDLSNGLTSIKWNLYGKAAEVVKDNGQTFTYKYDPMGNRFSKTTTTISGTGHTALTEYYIREAGGNELATYRHMKRYTYADIYGPVIDQHKGDALFPAGLTAVLGDDAGFSTTLLSSAATLAPSFITSQIEDRSVGFFVEQSAAARDGLLAATPDMFYHLVSARPAVAGMVYPVAELDPTPFMPLIEGIEDEEALKNNALLLFENADIKARFMAMHGMEPGSEADNEQLAAGLAQDIGGWRKDGKAVQSFLYLLKTDVEDPESSYYKNAVQLLLADSGYLNQPVRAPQLPGPGEPGDPGEVAGDPGATAQVQTLESELTTRLRALDRKDDKHLITEISNYYEDDFSAQGKSVADLRAITGDAPLISLLYEGDKADFLAGLLEDAAAKDVLTDAMNAATGISSLDILKGLADFDASLTTQLAEVMDYDRLYLAEHVLYGSSRLGTKEYYPNQYKYEWNMAKTVAQNNAMLDSSEFSYRRPWYSAAYQSLIAADQQSPYAHANTEALYSSRVIGQKKYELTNHLGNVMAVVSDKITETPVMAGAVPGALVKRAALSAAYDYYPFGMQMPGRTVEDQSIHCVPVSRTRYVNQLVQDYAVSASLLSAATGSGPGVSVQYLEGEGKLQAVAEEDKDVALGVEMALPQLASGQEGLEVSFTVDAFNDQELTALLKRNAGGDEWETVTAAKVPGKGLLKLSADALSSNDQLKIELSVTARKVELSQLAYYKVTKASQTYVTLSCDTDATFAGNYRFGFNGKQKDDEIAGVGNYQDYGWRFYDTRLGRFVSIDPLAKAFSWWTPYQFAGNTPVQAIDLDGGEVKRVTHYLDQHRDGSLFATKTDVEIKQDATISIEFGGRVYKMAATLTEYVYRDRVYPAVPMLEPVCDGCMTPSAAYDYTQVNIAGKPSDDINYYKNGKDGWVGSRMQDIYERDMNAPDNAIVVQDLEVLEVAKDVILRRSPIGKVIDKITDQAGFAKKKKKQDFGSAGGSEHTANARPSSQQTHQQGMTRKQQDRQGAGGMTKKPRRKPKGWTGPWP